jgi:hypothetical protein
MQGESSFSQECLKHLAIEIENKGTRFEKVNKQVPNVSTFPWSDYKIASNRFLDGKFASPRINDKDHFHYNESPITYIEVAQDFFSAGVFVTTEGMSYLRSFMELPTVEAPLSDAELVASARANSDTMSRWSGFEEAAGDSSVNPRQQPEASSQS